ncbi:helix-turn-helix domain-containing protein [uncultured Corynebacterium sp.]|uniref:helix-turn-helix domain-containing protein n=1 Tax=uncultured Corynebacterium sp. TaxID=159447 RepID=UPI0035A6B805
MSETNNCTHNEELWLSPAEAGQQFPGGLSASTVREWCHAGRFPGAFQTPTGRWRIPASAVDRVAGGAV